MKTVRTLVVCLSLIIAGVLFNTGSAYAAGPGSKGGDTSCTTQLSPYGNPVIRCTLVGNNKSENGSAPKHEWHRRHHHFYFHHRFYRSWHHRHYRYHSHHFHHSYHHHH